MREALIDAFDFEWTNKTIMYGSYERTQSVFQNSPMMANGKPSAAELALLEPFRGKVPDEVFGEPYRAAGRPTARARTARWLRKAVAACSTRPAARSRTASACMPDGEPFTIEFLIDEPTFKPHHLPYIKNLATLGIEATLRIVDPVQYRARVDDFDFDITVERFELLLDAGRFAAHLSFVAGGGDQGLAKSRRHRRSGDRRADRRRSSPPRRATELTTACRALDRVIRAGRYWIPHWYKASHWIAYWDMFGFPAAQPRYFRGIPETWWSEPGQGGES